jgi:hypothetical protein
MAFGPEGVGVGGTFMKSAESRLLRQFADNSLVLDPLSRMVVDWARSRADRLDKEMVDAAAAALGGNNRQRPMPPPAAGGGGLVPPVPPQARLVPVPTRVGPAPFDPALGAITAGNVAGALGAVLMGLRADEVAKAQAAQEFATRQAAEQRERQGIGRTVGIGDLARELQQKALGGPTAAEKQLRTLEDARELQRMAADRLRELVEQGKRPQMGPGFAT